MGEHLTEKEKQVSLYAGTLQYIHSEVWLVV